jgi:hypothetical protein
VSDGGIVLFHTIYIYRAVTRNLYLIPSCCHISIQSSRISNEQTPLLDDLWRSAISKRRIRPFPTDFRLLKDKDIHEISRCRHSSSHVQSVVYFRSAPPPQRCLYPCRCCRTGGCRLRRSRRTTAIAIANPKSIANAKPYSHPNAGYCKLREYSHMAHG